MKTEPLSRRSPDFSFRRAVLASCIGGLIGWVLIFGVIAAWLMFAENVLGRY